MIPEKYKHYFWGENKLFFPEEEFVIKMSEPRVFVRYKLAGGYFASYEEFYSNIAEVQFIDGDRPESEEKMEEILTDIWNYIALEERKLEGDLSSGDIEFLF